MLRFRSYLPIVACHKVGRFQGDHVPTVSVEAFERQLTFLAQRGLRVLSLEEVACAADE